MGGEALPAAIRREDVLSPTLTAAPVQTFYGRHAAVLVPAIITTTLATALISDELEMRLHKLAVHP